MFVVVQISISTHRLLENMRTTTNQIMYTSGDLTAAYNRGRQDSVDLRSMSRRNNSNKSRKLYAPALLSFRGTRSSAASRRPFRDLTSWNNDSSSGFVEELEDHAATDDDSMGWNDGSSMGFVEELADYAATDGTTDDATYDEIVRLPCRTMTRESGQPTHKSYRPDTSRRQGRGVIVQGANDLGVSSYYGPTMISGDAVVIQGSMAGRSLGCRSAPRLESVERNQRRDFHDSIMERNQRRNPYDNTELLAQASTMLRSMESEMTPAQRARMSWARRY